jgi:lipopolysaccharide/colanic/teichoic acid biosynthesis glycosyltransferase
MCPDPVQRFSYLVLKRALDIFAAVAGLILLAPTLALIAIIIFARSGRPVVIGQERVGCGDRNFRLYKFRSLPLVSLQESAYRWAPPVVHGWEAFLRSTGLDELPQLWNVLKGEMSMVGPRPERPEFVERFRRELPSYATRHCLQVGITGWAQVHGLRGDTSIPKRIQHDLYYLRHWSLALDLRILYMTLENLFRELGRRGVAVEKSADVRSV